MEPYRGWRTLFTLVALCVSILAFGARLAHFAPSAFAFVDHKCLSIPIYNQQGMLDITTGLYRQNNVSPSTMLNTSPDGKQTARLMYQPPQGRMTPTTLLLDTRTETDNQSIPIEVLRNGGLSSTIQW